MFPNWIYNMSSITYISVILNRFYGRIPVLDIGLTLPKLFGLNNFTGHIPVSLFNISGPEFLELAENSFVGPVPLNIGGLQNLRYLTLGYNRFGIGQAQILKLHANNFGGSAPKAIANLSTQLTVLLLGQNQLFGSLRNLMNLTYLGMEANLLGCSIPTAIGKLQKTTVVVLGWK
uniref:Uncharacterized protein n=1 Tax=Nelumbo nucifera TaxID=4432 RepID=A0A822Y750_NELNU|nr:TPA_asm: hypothetical protein HUJ06_031292 [Nelumbo nucifera]